jgi:hypothetical protein
VPIVAMETEKISELLQLQHNFEVAEQLGVL